MRVWAVDMGAYTHPLLTNADPDAQLTDIGLDLLDLWEIRSDIELALNVVIPEANFDKWRFVRDVVGVCHA
jgi:acyl carrier protein